MRIAVAVLGCLYLCGGQWGALQVVAWTKMIDEGVCAGEGDRDSGADELRGGCGALPEFASSGAWVGYRPPVPPPRLAA